LFNAEFTNEKVSVAMLCFGIFMIALGFRKHEQKRWIPKRTKNITISNNW